MGHFPCMRNGLRILAQVRPAGEKRSNSGVLLRVFATPQGALSALQKPASSFPTCLLRLDDAKATSIGSA
jgi:hypothetical protein